MYYFKKQGIKINKTKASGVIGITREYLTHVMNRKMPCSKIVAFCITKYLDKEAEIEDYFEKGE